MKFNSLLATTISSWTLFILILATEFFAGFKTFITTILWHHWIAKIIIITIIYLIIGFSLPEQPRHQRQAWMSVLSVITLTLLFFIILYLVEA